MIQARRRILKCVASARVIRVDPDWFFVCFSNEARRQKVGRAGFKALGRARASMDIDGQVKILADKATDEILGVHIIGARAADMIAAGVTAMEFRAAAEDVSRMSHAHPTYMEAVKEACLAATDNRPIHV